jgi:hypothetical protein
MLSPQKKKDFCKISIPETGGHKTFLNLLRTYYFQEVC